MAARQRAHVACSRLRVAGRPVSGVPVWLSLYDADGFIYGGDDHADLNPALTPPRRPQLRARHGRRRDRQGGSATRAASSLATATRRRSVTGSRRGLPRRHYRRHRRHPSATSPTTATTSTAPPPPPPPPPPPTFPDLVISALARRRSRCQTRARRRGAFQRPGGRLRHLLVHRPRRGSTGDADLRVRLRVGTHEARADYLNQVVESDETNNNRSIDPIC